MGHVQVRGTPFRLWESVDVGWVGTVGVQERAETRGMGGSVCGQRERATFGCYGGSRRARQESREQRNWVACGGAPLNGIHLWRWRQGPCRDAGIPLPVWLRAVGKSPPNDPVWHPVLFHRLLFHEALQDAQWGRGSLLNQRGWEEAISTGQTITWLLSSHHAPPLPANAVRAST